jgi:hypothetical protein
MIITLFNTFLLACFPYFEKRNVDLSDDHAVYPPPYKVKVKISLLQAVEAHRVARG